MRSLVICINCQITFGVVKEGKMDRECGTNREEMKCIENFGGKNLKESRSLEDLDVDGNIILEWIMKM